MLTINVGNSTYRLQGSQIFVVLANGQPTINGLTGMFREVTPTAMTMPLDAENMLWAAVSAALAPTPAPAPKPSTK